MLKCCDVHVFMSVSGVSQWYMEGRAKYGRNGYIQASKTFDDISSKSMTGKVVAVTGANSGIGYATAMRLAEMDADVHLVCRNPDKSKEARENIIASTGNSKVYSHVCDVAVLASVRAFGTSFVQKFPRLDILVNNAGSMPSTRTKTSEGNECIMATMLGGTMLLTDLLVPSLRQSEDARVINVSSGGAYGVKAHTTDLNCDSLVTYDGTFFYAMAKRNQIILTEMWDAFLRAQHIPITVHAMHPGWASTQGLQAAMPDFHKSHVDTLRTAAEGADTIVYLACSDSESVKYQGSTSGGKFWFDRHIVPAHMPWAGTDSTDAEKRDLSSV